MLTFGVNSIFGMKGIGDTRADETHGREIPYCIYTVEQRLKIGQVTISAGENIM